MSCETLYDLVGAEVVIGETSHSWTFYAEIGEARIQVFLPLMFLFFQVA